jgi:hypothetical protein
VSETVGGLQVVVLRQLALLQDFPGRGDMARYVLERVVHPVRVDVRRRHDDDERDEEHTGPDEEPDHELAALAAPAEHALAARAVPASGSA